MKTIKQLSAILAANGVHIDSVLCMTNPKTLKNDIATGIVHLRPEFDQKKICPHSGHCAAVCLDYAGNPAYESAKTQARNARSRLALENPQLWALALVVAIARKKRALAKDGKKLAVRLNGTSDLEYTAQKYHLAVTRKNVELLRSVGISADIGEDHSIFSVFPDIQFYDYTKSLARLSRAPTNYYLTFSLDGDTNVASAIKALRAGVNVAVPFWTLPHELTLVGGASAGYARITTPVIDGDLTDYRPDDPIGVIVGLKYKRASGTARFRNDAADRFVIAGDIVTQDPAMIAKSA